ncbi:MAG: gliding motility protein GldB, partial [Tannerella sp.]|nr:gliding motility protein GldB [Tannerella sp.]
EEFDWLKKNESALWTTIIERKHLYNPDIVTTDKYFLPSPTSFLSDEAPGNIGSFIGFCIVKSYMNKTKSGFQELIKNNDSQDILTKSKYKPK